MRTTLDFDDRVLRKAKERAAQLGITLTRLMEDAVRGYLAPPSAMEPPFKLKLLIKKGRLPGVDVADRDALYRWLEDT